MSDQNETVQEVNGAAAPDVNDATTSASIQNLVDEPLPLTDIKETEHDAEGEVPLDVTDDKAEEAEEGAGQKRKAEDDLAGESKKQAMENGDVATNGTSEEVNGEDAEKPVSPNGHAEEEEEKETKAAEDDLVADYLADEDKLADEPKGKEPETSEKPTSAESKDEAETSQSGGPEDPVVVEDDKADVAPPVPSEING